MSMKQLPQEAHDFARKVVELAREHGIRQVHASFNFDTYGHNAVTDWDAPVKLNWEQGRHGAWAGINLTSELRNDIKERVDEN